MNETTMPAADAHGKAKQTAKDSVFCDLFGHPKYLFQLYQALHPEDTETTEADIVTVTLKNVLLNQMYNDLGFTVGRKRPLLMILLEAQSTWTINVIVRVLMYLVNSWQEFIEGHKLNVYGSKRIELPKPELYVIYTGSRKAQPEWISLADEFFAGDHTFLDVKVKVIYDGREGDIINQYVTFTRVYDEQIARYGRTQQAVLETIRICKDSNVLKEYLENREKEVIDIMTTLFDQAYAVERYGDEREAIGIAQGEARGLARGIAQGEARGLAKGEARGEIKGALKQSKLIALQMKEDGFPEETIARIHKVSLQTVRQWLAEASTELLN